LTNREKGRAAPSSPPPTLPTGGSGLLGWLSKDSPHPRWIESKPSLGTIAESHSAELVGVLVDEIATYAEQARDRRGVDQFSAGLLFLE
jgi:hypothetical protein